ncbi:hypothetical protein IHE61_02865 [Streptomyces sp. GKU 257-1]|nr:hypothetical protein [Streptomyces sp. GKU 257-1]
MSVPRSCSNSSPGICGESWEREKILGSDEGSIRCIAAIMGAYAEVTEDSGNGHYDLRYDVPMLTQLYQGSDLKQWEAAFEKRKARNDWGKLDPQNPMAPLGAQRNQVFLDAALPEHPWKVDPRPATPVRPPGPPPGTPTAPATPTPRTGPSPAPR